MSSDFVAEDLLRYQSITSLTAHGERCAGAVTSPNRYADGYTSAIWLVAANTAPVQLTSGTSSDNSPAWSPDGSMLAFISNRTGGSPQIYLIRSDGGEARPLVNPVGVIAVSWDPDGQHVYATASVAVDPQARGHRQKGGPNSTRPQVVWRLPYQADGAGYILDREIHLFRVNIMSGETRQITDGPYDVLNFDPAPDGRRIAYVRKRPGREAHRSDLWVCDANGGNARQISHDVVLTQSPRWSPDGRRIVFAGSPFEADPHTRLWYSDMTTGTVSPIGDESLEVAPGGSIHWAADGVSVVLVIVRSGLTQMARVWVPDGGMEIVAPSEGHVGRLAATFDRLCYTHAGADTPVEFHSCNWFGGDRRQLSYFNGWWREKRLPSVTRRQFQVPDGGDGVDTIDGWLFLPPDNAGDDRPLLIDVHGGPHSVAFIEFSHHVYRYLLCARGWAILALNPLGSSSYGIEFAHRLSGRWGELDFGQHMAAAAQLRKEGIVGERLSITGKSYGGFMSAWAIGHSREFDAAVISAPVSNLESHFGTSDGGYYMSPHGIELDGRFDRKRAAELSPVQHLTGVSTPTLILQGSDDLRCPVGQSQELFASIVRGGNAPVELVLYPGADHHLAEQGKPSFRVDYVNRIVDWLERWGRRNHPDSDRHVDGISPTESTSRSAVRR